MEEDINKIWDVLTKQGEEICRLKKEMKTFQRNRGHIELKSSMSMKNIHKLGETNQNTSIGNTRWKQDRCTLNSKEQRLRMLIPVKNYVKEYCERTSLHGFCYITDTKSPLIGRLMWILFLVMSFATCTYLIRKIWIKWDESPVILTLSSMRVNIGKIPFPAVTVCRNWMMDENINIQQIGKDHEILKILCALKGSFYPSNVNIPEIPDCLALGDIHDNLDFSQLDFYKNITPLIQVKSDIKNRDIFYEKEAAIWNKPILTDYGICQSFNILHGSDMYKTGEEIVHNDLAEMLPKAKDWTPEGGYMSPLTANESTYPKRSDTKMIIGGLSMNIMKNDEVKPILKPGNGSFWVSIHHPTALPNMLKDSTELPENKFMRIVLSPTIIYSNKNLKSYPLTKRKCLFPEERDLAFFKTYNYMNCEMEVFEELSAEKCGCVGLHVPRLQNIPYCGATKWSCRFNLFIGINNKTYSPFGNCPGTCSDIQYTAEIAIDQLSEEDIIEYGRAAKIEVYFKDLDLTVMQKSELYDWADFLANCGGFLGLCLGFSALSVVEVIYFFTIRLLPKNLVTLHAGRMFNVKLP